MKTFVLAGAIVGAISMVATSATAAPSTVSSRGGGRSCGTWVQNHVPGQPATSDQVNAETWVVGYLSGVASGAGVELVGPSSPDNASLFQWLTNYCSAHPLDNIRTASDQLILILANRKQ